MVVLGADGGKVLNPEKVFPPRGFDFPGKRAGGPQEGWGKRCRCRVETKFFRPITRGMGGPGAGGARAGVFPHNGGREFGGEITCYISLKKGLQIVLPKNRPPKKKFWAPFFADKKKRAAMER